LGGCKKVLGEFIKKTRIARGLSQRELGRLAGLSGAFISQLESGETKNPSYTTIKNIAQALKVSFKDMTAQTSTLVTVSLSTPKTPDEIMRELNASLPATIPVYESLNSKKIVSYIFLPKILLAGGVKMRGITSPVDFENIVRKGDVLLCSHEITPMPDDLVIYPDGSGPDVIAYYKSTLKNKDVCVVVKSVHDFKKV
jgi:transcriptional regulator with XRE-family HTH domain